MSVSPEPTAPAWARATSAKLATTDARRLALAVWLEAAFESLAELGQPGLSVAVWMRDSDSGVVDAILAIRMAKLDDGMDSAANLVGLKEDEGRAAGRAVPGCPDLDDSDRGRPRCRRLQSHHAYGIRCRSYRREGGPLDAGRGNFPDDNGHSVAGKLPEALQSFLLLGGAGLVLAVLALAAAAQFWRAGESLGSGESFA